MAELTIQLFPSEPIYTDKGSGAPLNVAIYQPQLPDGWSFLGHLARTMPSSWEYTDSEVAARAPTALGVMASADDPSALSPVAPHEPSGQPQPLWTDQHSGGKQNIELYAFQATETANTYISLGLFASIVEDYGQDPRLNPAWSKLVAVRSDLVTTGAAGGQIWTDQHSGADGSGEWKDVSLWNLAGTGGLVPLGAFVAAEGYPSSPSSTSPATDLIVSRISPR